MHDAPPIYALLHIPKAAGKTLRAIAHVQYWKRTEIVKLPKHGWRDALREGACLSGVRLITDVPMVGVHDLIPQPVRYVTMLRHPITRSLSYWRYAHPDADFTDFRLPSIVARNAMTRALAGVENPRQKLPADLLETAQANMVKHFALVGVSERFDESVVLAKRVLGWRAILYQSRNVSRPAPRQSEPPRWVLEMITEQNVYDLALYTFAVRRLDEAIAAHGPSFAVEVEALKRLQASEGGVGTVNEKPPRLPRNAYRRHLPQVAGQYRAEYPREWRPFRDYLRELSRDWRTYTLQSTHGKKVEKHAATPRR